MNNDDTLRNQPHHGLRLSDNRLAMKNVSTSRKQSKEPRRSVAPLLGRAIPLSVPLLLLLASCAGDGAAGKNGTTCSVEESDGEKTLVCDDGTSVIIPQGEDGETGEPGDAGDPGDTGDPGAGGDDAPACAVTDNGDGTLSIECPDSPVITVSESPVGKPLIVTSLILPGEECIYGGQLIEVGYDANDNDILDDGEVAHSHPSCVLGVWEGTYVIETEADFDDLQQVGWITGSLIISATELDDLSDLSALQRVDGDVTIQDNPNLTDLSGLENLVQVGDDLEVGDNGVLTNVDGLSGLQTIGGEGYFYENAVLVDVSGLSELVSVGSDLTFYQNDLLETIALPSLESADAIQIWENPALTSLDFPALESVGVIELYTNLTLPSAGNYPLITSLTNLYITSNAALTSVAGLSALTETTDRLQIQDNDSLLNVDGLEALTEVGGNFYVDNNDSLVSLAGLANVDSVGSDLSIVGNTSLATCAATAYVAGITTIGGTTTVSGNDDEGTCL